MTTPHAPKPDLINLNDLRPYLKLLGKNWWLLFFLSAMGYGAGRLITHRQLDIHLATAEVLLESQETFNYQEQMLGQLGATSLSKDVQNQLRILQSYDLVGRAVDLLQQPVDCYFVGRVRTSQVEGFGNIAVEVRPDLFNPEFLGIPIDIFIESPETYLLKCSHPDGWEIEEIRRFDEVIEGPDLALTVRLTDLSLKGANPQRLDEARRQHFRIQVFNRDQRINQFRNALEVENIERTSILTLKSTSTLARRGKQFLDTLSQVYIKYTREAKLDASRRTETFIDVQLEELTDIMDSLERQVDLYKEDREVLDLSREQNEFFNSLVELETQQRQLDLRLEAMRSLQKYLAVGVEEFGLPPTTYLFEEDPMLIQQVNQLFQLRTSRTAALIDVTEDNYAVRRLDSAISNTRFSIARYIDDTRQALQSQRTGLNREIVHLEGRLSGIPATQRDIMSMERKLQVNEELYIFLLQSKASTIIARAGITPEASLIEQARYGGVIGPDKKRTILTYTAAGFMLALAIAFARMVFFERIETIEELRENTYIPVIGGVPHEEDANEAPLIVLEKNRGQTTESFRSLRTNLQYLLTQEDAKTLLISSLHPQEGKSFISSNLTAVLAKAGKKAILLDFDMHKPKVHKNFNLPNSIGLSNYLVGRASIPELIQNGQDANLDVITAGPVPPNASELILSERLPALLVALKEDYDYIILDTPPILLLSDALVLMTHVDAALLVTNTEKSSKRGIRLLEESLAQNNLSHISFVLNNIRMRRWQYYYSKYAYKYGLGYGYGYSYGYGGYSYGPDYGEDSSSDSQA
ncbi:MAG: polysaccharide biosynthesis tyrosine autokinase [Flavobacteriales bacterium]